MLCVEKEGRYGSSCQLSGFSSQHRQRVDGAVGREVNEVQSGLCAYPQSSRRILTELAHESALQPDVRRVRVEGDRPVAVIAAQPLVGGYPHVALPVHQQVIDEVVGQSVLLGQERIVITLEELYIV